MGLRYCRLVRRYFSRRHSGSNGDYEGLMSEFVEGFIVGFIIAMLIFMIF